MKPAFLATILTAGCLAQQPLAPEKAADAGSISGTVASAAGEPLRRVTVRLAPLRSGQAVVLSTSGSTPESETDSQGNFSIDPVAPGRYLLMAERSGYLNALYSGARGGALTISAGQKATGIVIKMTPQGIIAGRVVDEENEPVSGATVGVGA